MARDSKLLRTTMLLTFIIILSKIAGFAREMIMASTFGLTIESDAYGVAYSILSIFTILFGAAIGSTFIPIYTKALVEKGDLYANEYASNVFNLYVIVAVLTSIAAYIFAPFITAVMWRNPEGGELVTSLTRLMLPSLVCWCVSGVLVNLLDARKHFVPEQLIGFALSFCVIVACLAFGTIEAVSVATSITALVQVFILAPFLRGQFRWRPVLNLKSRRLRTTFILALPALISVAFDEINHAADKIFGSEIGIGVVSSLTKSYTLVQTAISVLVIPITTVMFTQLSQYAAKNQMDDLKDTVRASIEIVAFITLPIIVLCVVMSTDVIGVFYQRGSFTYEDTLFTAPVFAFYIVGIFGFGLRNFLTRVFYAIQKTRIPMYLGIISVSLNIFLDWMWKDTLGARGLTLATSVASLTGGILMLIVLRRHIGPFGAKRSVLEFIKMFVAAGVSGAAVWFAVNHIPVQGPGFSQALARLLTGVLVGLLAYIGCALALRIHETKRVLDMFRRRLRRGKREAPAAESPAEVLMESGTEPEALEAIEALEAADLNYPGPQLVPQPPAYRTARALGEIAFGTPYRPAEPSAKMAHHSRAPVEDLSAQTQAFHIPDSIRSEAGPYSPTQQTSAYEGHARYRTREEFEKEAMQKYETKKRAAEQAKRTAQAAQRPPEQKRSPGARGGAGPAGAPFRRRIGEDDDNHGRDA